MSRISVRHIPFVLIASLVLNACSSNSNPDERDMLVKVGNAVLTRQDLQQAMPYGLSQDDSTKFVKAFIADWIDKEIIEELAAANIHDTDEIDNMVAEYRRSLIMREYRKRMYEQNADEEPSEADISEYYEEHKDVMRTTEPYIKGIYIKVADQSKHLTEIRHLYKSEKTSDIDRLEKICSDEAISYDYFQDHWVEWSAVEAKIPYNFGNDASLFLKSHPTIDTSHDGVTHLLSITKYLPTGSIKPIDVARQDIIDRIKSAHRAEYDHKLRKELYDAGVKSGKIIIY
jgi:hypothetical protein